MIQDGVTEIYRDALQEEIQQGVVTRIPKDESLFLNRAFVIPKKDGRKRDILDCPQVKKISSRNIIQSR
ncbi:MAG: hypothetical protein EZS28_043789 [Streblomastix strix]|uniref:Reverse transcriptase domain-containing protein n=1 Tax=Streblomastix strix TaxID=222440 RepID=A0A5J4TQI6_9EUKA|nr:MAG: hypothetical protein EZS28_043789 [Streblomastix strix]